MRKAFSLAELMITLVIMSVISAILIPTIVDMSPNDEKFLFKSAYRMVETVVNDLINDTDLYSTGLHRDASNNTVSSTYFCTNFSRIVNVIGTPNCNLKNEPGPDIATGGANEPNLITTNGMMWWGLNDAFDFDPMNSITNHAHIFVDVNGTDGDGVLNEDIFRIIVIRNGRIIVNDIASDDPIPSVNMAVTAGSNSNAVEYLRSHDND